MKLYAIRESQINETTRVWNHAGNGRKQRTERNGKKAKWETKRYMEGLRPKGDAQDRTFWKSSIRTADPTEWEKAKKQKNKCVYVCNVESYVVSKMRQKLCVRSHLVRMKRHVARVITKTLYTMRCVVNI